MTIGDWMATPKGAVVLGYAFGFGASVVIIGALFKIQHWPGASFMLTAGMGVEALLFAISAFGKPHKDYHWDAVFPQLKGDGEHEGISSFGGGGGGSSSGNIGGGSGSSIGGTNLDSVPGLSEEEVEKLSLGISKLSETASQLANLSSLSGVTSSLVTNMSAASDSVESFTSTQIQINSTAEALVASYKDVADGVSAAKQSTDGLIGSMTEINKNLSSINSVYEIQLKIVSSQNNVAQLVNDELGKVNSSITSSLNNIEDFKAQTAKMSQQVSSLNDVYGSMLNALSI